MINVHSLLRTSGYAIIGFIFFSSAGLAQCTKDTDCKGDRVCIKGACAEPPLIDLKHVCSLFGDVPTAFTPGLVNPDAERLLKKIGDAVLLRDLPEVKSGPVTSAVATIQGAKRLIIYNPSFIRRIESEGGEWPVLFAFAHELGHHVNGDVWIQNPDEQYQREFSSDQYAARVLFRLGASRQQVVASLDAYPVQSTALHPGVSERKDRVSQEYEAMARGSQPTCPPGKVLNGNQCVDRCRAGERWDGNRCVPPSCSGDSVWNGSACVSRCKAGEEWSNGQCVSLCDSDERWSGSSCIKRCKDCEEWDGVRCINLCEDGERCRNGECVSTGAAPGTILRSCGCWGAIWPGPRVDKNCASGWSEPVACAGWCAGGGYPWGIVCR